MQLLFSLFALPTLFDDNHKVIPVSLFVAHFNLSSRTCDNFI